LLYDNDKIHVPHVKLKRYGPTTFLAFPFLWNVRPDIPLEKNALKEKKSDGLSCNLSRNVGCQGTTGSPAAGIACQIPDAHGMLYYEHSWTCKK
jgi:hypothetical protein